ncbi:MAG: magnesium chelatase ATPase subunit D, partial [Hyphomicrobium sp.]
MSAGLAPDISRWSDAVLAAVVMAVAPQSIGGIIVKGQCGPVRDAWFALVKAWLPAAAPLRRIPVDVADGRLIGGLDLAATLSQGHPVAERGLLAAADGGVIVLPSAERVGKSALAAIAGALDCGQISVERDGITAINEARFGVIAFDESRDGEDTIAALLRDRLAIEIDLDAIRLRDAVSMAIAPGIFENARAAMVDVRFSDHDAQALCGTAAALGIASMRAPLQALCVARALAAFGGSPEISAENLEAAVRLVLVPRATQI